MNFALVSTGEYDQDKDLIREAVKRNHRLDIIKVDSFSIGNQILLKKYDLIYWRVGNTKIRQISAQFCHDNKIPFINSGYYRHPLLGEKSYQLYQANRIGLKIPKSILFRKDTCQFREIEKKITIPFILKKNIGARGQSVWLINNANKMKEVIKDQPEKEFLAQKYLPNTGDYRVIVVGEKAIGLFKRIPKKGEFKANISLGGSGQEVTDSEKNAKLKRMSEKICRVLGLEIAGVDFIESKNDFYFIETNSIVQWQGFQKTTKINVSEKIIDYFEAVISSGSNQKSN